MNKLRTGDEVIVISGKDRGKTGTITKFLANKKCKKTSKTKSSSKYSGRNFRKRVSNSRFEYSYLQ